MKKYYSLLLVAACAVVTDIAQAATISVVPGGQSVSVGNSVDVGIRVSGLGTGGAPSLSAFSFDLTYDLSILNLISVTFGDPLLTPTNQLELSGVPSISGFVPGVGDAVSVFQISLDPANTLNTQQADAFRMVTIRLLALQSGVSALGFTNLSLADASDIPNDITSTFTADSGSITVNATSEVPEPGSALLVLAGGVALLTHKLRSRRR